MRPGHFERALQSRVARRIGAAFVLSAILPLAGLALVTTTRTRTALHTQAVDDLRVDAKAAANEGLGRLYLFAESLRVAGELLLTSGAPRGDDARRLFPHPPAWLAVFTADREWKPMLGAAPALALADREWAHLRNTGRLIVPAGNAWAGPVLVVTVHAADGSLAAAPLDTAWFFATDEADALPPATGLCILGHGAEIVCSETAPQALAIEATASGMRDVVVGSGDDRHLAHVRQLPVAAVYGNDPWQVVMTRSAKSVYEPLRGFTRDFWIVALISLMTVSWVSLWQVRRQLRPLDRLMEATDRLRRRNFDEPVELVSADEFQDLGEAFNSLAAQLKQQFADLESLSLGTLDTLARAIDAKSQWTAGHSERVTRLAVAIGRAFPLPEDELIELRHGGPLHDIGKLATPPEILDKPGRLTDAEFEIIKQHTTQGAHILKPIAAFERLLPIVEQHHERWDGRGYPKGLAGTAIKRTARVLAVADVYDAMTSDRPYRGGRPPAEAIAMIAAAAGSHFDPDAVNAFLAVTRSDDFIGPESSSYATVRTSPIGDNEPAKAPQGRVPCTVLEISR